jgi:hypothetical protein
MLCSDDDMGRLREYGSTHETREDSKYAGTHSGGHITGQIPTHAMAMPDMAQENPLRDFQDGCIHTLSPVQLTLTRPARQGHRNKQTILQTCLSGGIMAQCGGTGSAGEEEREVQDHHGSKVSGPNKVLEHVVWDSERALPVGRASTSPRMAKARVFGCDSKEVLVGNVSHLVDSWMSTTNGARRDVALKGMDNLHVTGASLAKRRANAVIVPRTRQSM